MPTSAPPLSAKFRRLEEARAVHGVQVPRAVYLDAVFFREALADFDALDRRLHHILEEIEGTSGAFLGEQILELETLLADLDFGARGRGILWDRFQEAFPGDPGAAASYAVRSAAPGEDSAQHSHAGLYTSRLGVGSRPDIERAILEVWASFFDYAALLHRLGEGVGRPTDGPSNPMAVMIQPMVDARLAGVCFTVDPVGGGGCVVESVEGLGDRLVSGTAAPTVLRGPALADADAPYPELLRTAQRLEEAFGHPLDLEWAWDGNTLWILQARPISTLASSAASSAGGSPQPPVCEGIPLYGAPDEALERMAPVPDFATYFRQKRRPLFQFAQRMGVHCGQALLLRYNRAGLADTATLAPLLGVFTAPEVVVDAHGAYRQRVLPRGALEDELGNLAPRGGATLQVVVREYIRGDKGIISRALPDDAVLYEVSDEGLLALNRGTAGGRSFRIQRAEDPAPDLPKGQVATFLDTTREARRLFGPNQLEWVMDADRLTMVDYSPRDDHLPSHASGHIISPGHAVSTVLRLGDAATLRRLSEGPAISLKDVELAGAEELENNSYLRRWVERLRGLEQKPIVLAPRPFAILAALIPHASGFVFEHGSTLCHLAILLRERGVPALESSELYASLETGDPLTLDARPPGDWGN